MTDGSGSAKDEHLVPGPRQPAVRAVPRAARHAAASTGHIVAEINTRKAGNREAREADLLETLAFSRLHFAGTGV